MILVASAAALAWSRAARGAAGLGGLVTFTTVAVTLLAAFFALRVADEHKDAATDRVSRPELPVPRGLVTLAELRLAAGPLVVAAVAANLLLDPRLLWPLALAAAWLALMTREFFVPEWLRARPLPYLLSHMVVMPLLLLAATAADWIPAGEGPPGGLAWFLAATFATGLVLELGRKIRAPDAERPGVDTYTSAWGVPRATAGWLAALFGSATMIAVATLRAGAAIAPIAATAGSLLFAIPALRLLAGARSVNDAKRVETTSAIWTLVAYLLLALPWLERAWR